MTARLEVGTGDPSLGKIGDRKLVNGNRVIADCESRIWWKGKSIDLYSITTAESPSAAATQTASTLLSSDA